MVGVLTVHILSIEPKITVGRVLVLLGGSVM